MSSRISHHTLEVFNPATGEDLSLVPITSNSDLDQKLDKARKAAESYNYSSFFRRQNLMIQFRKGIVRHMDEFIETICSETGKKRVEALMEVFISIEHITISSKILYEALGKRSRRVGIQKTRN